MKKAHLIWIVPAAMAAGALLLVAVFLAAIREADDDS